MMLGICKQIHGLSEMEELARLRKDRGMQHHVFIVMRNVKVLMGQLELFARLPIALVRGAQHHDVREISFLMRHADLEGAGRGIGHGIRRANGRVQPRELMRVLVLWLFRHHSVTFVLRLRTSSGCCASSLASSKGVSEKGAAGIH